MPQQGSGGGGEEPIETDLRGFLKEEFQKIGTDVKSVETRLSAIEDKLSSMATAAVALRRNIFC